MHYKQNNKESKTYVQGLRPFGNTLPRGVKGILKKSGYNYSEIISKWNMLVGKDISSCSYPKSIKMTKGDTNGLLVLAVKRGNEITVEYSKKEQSLEKYISFMKYMHNLSSIAIDDKIPIIVTNIVRTINKHEKENLEESISMYIHTKIKLSKNNNEYSCQAISPLANKQFQYTITSKGLTDQS